MKYLLESVGSGRPALTFALPVVSVKYNCKKNIEIKEKKHMVMYHTLVTYCPHETKYKEMKGRKKNFV